MTMPDSGSGGAGSNPVGDVQGRSVTGQHSSLQN